MANRIERIVYVRIVGTKTFLPFTSLLKLEEYFPEWNDLGKADMFGNIAHGLREKGSYLVSDPYKLQKYRIRRTILNPKKT